MKSTFSNRGLTLIELLVAMTIFTVIVAVIISALIRSHKAKIDTEMLIEAEQNARIAVDVMASDIRCAGYNIDQNNLQGGIVYAGPFEIIFNANLSPYPDTASNPGFPRAMDPTANPDKAPPNASPAHYDPADNYLTGAETIRYSLDSNDDGVITETIDPKDDREEQRTPNPFDLVLIKEVYGKLSDGTNGGTKQEISLLRGPRNWPAQTEAITPLFQYWWDNDNNPSTPDTLFGDTNGDGKLSSAEINALNDPVPNPERINRVVITATAETRAPCSDKEYRRVTITSEVNTLRNKPRQGYTISGHTYFDANNDNQFTAGTDVDIDSFKVVLSSGQICSTGIGGLATGKYKFKVSPGVYTIRVFDRLGYRNNVGRGDTTADATIADVNLETNRLFGFRRVPLGYVRGIVFHDSLHPNQHWDSDEPGIAGVKVSVDGQEVITGSSGTYFFTVNADSPFSAAHSDTIWNRIVETDLQGYSSTVAETISTNNVEYKIISNNEVKFRVAKDCTAKVYFGDRKGPSGKIKGIVFDSLSAGKPGIPDVQISITQGTGASEEKIASGYTDATGNFSITVPINPGGDPYWAIETDPPGYFSLDSNRVDNIKLNSAGDSVTGIRFADGKSIALRLTGKALTVISTDLKEDNKADNDIIMGKEKNGENLLVWYNKYVSAGNPGQLGLFDSIRNDARTCTLSATGYTILALASGLINNDEYPDIISAMKVDNKNVWVWFTLTGGNKGKLPQKANKVYSTLVSQSALCAGVGMLGTPKTTVAFNDAYYDLAVGSGDSLTHRGTLEVFMNQSPDSNALRCTSADVYYYTAAAKDTLGEVQTLAIADVIGSGGGAPDEKLDIILGTKSAENQGKIVIFANQGTTGPGNFKWVKTLPAPGQVNAISTIDLKEDANNDVDIIVGTKTSDWTGKVEIWQNNNNGSFGNSDTAPTYTANPDGAILCVGAAKLCPDAYPDIVVGTKTSAGYTGKVLVYDCYKGRFPDGGPTDPSGGTETGEMRTLAIADFDKDGKFDFVVGERISDTIGKLIIFYR
ncbi:MAG: prepilin-type N-terminal cleavage/methylation domain-containing protein [Candidatus Edwardsbacteria bacterium]